MKFREKIAGVLIYGIVKTLSYLPLSMSQPIGRLIGRLHLVFNSRGAKVTLTNLEFCMPELGDAERLKLARESLMHTGQMIMETPASWLGDADRIYRWIREIKNESLVHDAREAGKPIIIILPHIGNWELFNVLIAKRVGSSTGLYAPPSQDYLKLLMHQVRSRYGNEILPTTVKGIGTLFKRVQAGGLVAVLPDQVPTTGKFVPFFGHEALTDVLLTRLRSRTGATVITCVIKRLPGARGFDVIYDKAHPDIYSDNPEVALRGMNLSIEACVRQAPEQYQWEYKRFREQPVGRFRLYNYKGESSEYH